MNVRAKCAIASAILVAVVLTHSAVATTPYPSAPLYNPSHPISNDPKFPYNPNNFSPAAGINLTTVPPATSAADADMKFNGRTAAVIAYAANEPLAGGNGETYMAQLLEKWAYPEYFNANPDGYPMPAVASILNHSLGLAGTDGGIEGTPFGSDEYDFTLNYYIPLIYRYYQPLMDNGAADYIINYLIGQATLAGLPSGRPVVGNLSTTYTEWLHVPDVIDIPETENHLLGIFTANYLGNQLLYQRTQQRANDNVRNGDRGNGAPNTTSELLLTLRGFLRDDFQEYNGRPYQDFSMSALLNLASYAYDDRVRLAARMVLDYVAAKIAVSSEDLRRAPPFRRRNELVHYGPTISGNFPGSPLALGSPLAVAFGGYEPDPQIAYYSLLAGNTGVFFSPAVAGTTSPPFSAGFLPGNYNWEMVHAGLCDYRIPPSILDLFITNGNRQFYQYFHHGSGSGEFADELYAGSPSYLISAGGRPTTYSAASRADVKAGAQVLLDALALYLGGLPAAVLEPLIQGVVNGMSSDLGAAMPTLFLPADKGLATPPGDPSSYTLAYDIQFGEYTTDESKSHLCVAPDFACGDNVYVPPGIGNDPGNVTNGNWTFVNHGGAIGKPGYYLAIYRVDNGNGGRAGLLEAYDTSRYLPNTFNATLSFNQFMADVLAANPSLNLQLGNNQPNSYLTHSGQSLTFTISPRGQILSTTAMNPAPASNSQFAAGTILNSAQGSGLVVISNPTLGTSITLDMRDINNISRTDENGTVEYGGEEVWVNFNYGSNQGDFAQPYRSLHDAMKATASPRPAKVFKIIAGSEHEAITINQPVTLIAVGGPVEISGQ